MTAVVVQLQDQFSNNIAGSGTIISLTLNGSGTLGGTTSLATAANGQATFTDLTITGAGTGLTFTASASPLTGATSSVFNVAPASSTNAVSASANPVPTGFNVVLTATITAIAPGGGTPTGTVQFLADGSPLGLPATLSGGAASVTNNSLSNGFHIITAQYAGDGNFIGSTNNLNPDLLVSSAPVVETAINQITSNGGVPSLLLAGIPGRTYYVQASTNLATWVDISTNVAGANGLWNVVDADATNYPARFYRTSDQP